MGRKANPYIRVTSVGSFVNSQWKTFWFKSIEKQLADIRAAECVKFACEERSSEEWKTMLARYNPLAEADRISDESTTFGKGVHRVVESYLLGTPLPTGMQPDVPTARQLTCGGYMVDWLKQTKAKPLTIADKPAVEFELKDEELGLVGHPDMVCTFGEDTVPFLIDWKTSKQASLDYIIQLALYAELMHRQYGIRVNDGAIIRTPSDPSAVPQFEPHEYHGLREKYLELAMEALDVFKFFSNKGRWRAA